MTAAAVDAVGQLLALVLVVASASTPSLLRARRVRRLVPGMSWRTAWQLTASEGGLR